MANVFFYYEGIETATLTASGGGDTDNLLDRNPTHKWTSGSLLAQSLVIDFGSARACDSIVLDGTNWDNLAEPPLIISLLSSPDNSIWTSRGTFTIASGSQILTFTSASVRYWKINFDSGLATYPQIGNIILGAKIEMTTPYDSGFSKSRKFATNKSRAIDGTLYSSQIYTGADNYNFRFSNITNTLSGYLNTLYNSVRGGLYPFYFNDVDSILTLVILNSDENPIEKVGYNLNNAELSFETFSVL